MVEEGEASLLKITKLIGLGETLGGGEPKKGNCMDWGQTELLPSSRTFKCFRSIFDTVYSEVPANSFCFLFYLLGSILRNDHTRLGSIKHLTMKF